MKNSFSHIISIILLLCLLVHAGDFEEGLNAAKHGDNKTATEYYLKAAEQGNARAQFFIGLIYEDNTPWISKDLNKAIFWYRKSAEQGYSDAQYALGVRYMQGQGIEKNLLQAAYWLRKGAEQGQHDASYSLSWMYKQGKGVKKNLVIATALEGISLSSNDSEYFKKNIEKKLTNEQATEVKELMENPQKLWALIDTTI